MTDSSGTVVWAADYKPFGQVDWTIVWPPDYGGITVNTIENNLRLAGQYYDAETGLHYNYHRYYHPATGRYLTPDPIGLLGGINLYSYVQNNPINFIDPLGLFSWGFGGTIGPVTISWDSSKPTKTNTSFVSDLEIGGGFSFTFDHPFPDSNPPTTPFDVNVGPSRWIGFSTDGDKFSIKIGLGVGLTPIDISSKGEDSQNGGCE